jgi:ATP-grasp domain, R2K clade family 3
MVPAARGSDAAQPVVHFGATASGRADPILHWQQLVVREFVPLRPIAADMGEKIPASFEFRTFWWRGKLVGAGPYFGHAARYTWTSAERAAALHVAGLAAARVPVTFLVVDVAQRADGGWIVIEVNDGQESGYGGASALGIWQGVLDLEAGGSTA